MPAQTLPAIDDVSLFEAYDDRAASAPQSPTREAKRAAVIRRRVRRNQAPSFVILIIGFLCASYFDPAVAFWSLVAIVGVMTLGYSFRRAAKFLDRILPAGGAQPGFA